MLTYIKVRQGVSHVDHRENNTRKWSAEGRSEKSEGGWRAQLFLKVFVRGRQIQKRGLGFVGSIRYAHSPLHKGFYPVSKGLNISLGDVTSMS
jgi:hypothetical protein